MQNNNQIERVGKFLHLSYLIILGVRKILKTKNAAEAISGHLAVLYIRIPFSDVQWDSVPNFIC